MAVDFVVMFADFKDSVVGWGCGSVILVLMLIGWAAQSIGKSASDALKSDTVKEAAKIGFWMWLGLSDDDDED